MTTPMRILSTIEELAEISGPICVAIGVFDGVHRGHAALIQRVMAEAKAVGGTAVVLTFDPHPARVLRPDKAPRLLTSTAHKERLIAALGCPVLLLVKFDADFAAQTPVAFIEALARPEHDLRCLCVGHQWAFGRNRTGNVDLLRTLGVTQGFATVEIDPICSGGETVSSTRIRRAIAKGDLNTARELLGRDYTILGTVQHGAKLGVKIGFPTANLATHNEQYPPDGVYAVRVRLRDETHRGVANIGIRPTVDGQSGRILEVHLFDYAADCYGEDMEVWFVSYLRPEKKFGSIEALKEQIARDVAVAREVEGAEQISSGSSPKGLPPSCPG